MWIPDMALEVNANIELLERDLDEQVDNYDERRKDNRRKSTRVAVATACISGITTVLIGLANIWEPARLYLNSAAIIASALVGIFTVQDNLFDFKKLWFLYTDKWIQSRQLRSDLQHAKASGSVSQEMLNHFYKRFQEIRTDLNDEWKALRGIK
jgi:hypothetical protein